MSYLVLARKYRPQKFSEVLGQEHITRTLLSSIENDRLGHAFLFSGPRGIGKTTTARLLAKAVNCSDNSEIEPCNQCTSCEQISRGNDVDVMEIDGASNNSVDQIRTLRENVQYAPAHNEKKIYIIDEVHMLSKSAFNALLKTLEEPPDHVIFIFATTEIDQVPDTIRSRCQRFDFRLIPQKLIVHCLEDICEKENIPVEKEALFLIAKFAEGSLRDAQSILDQMINFTGAGEEKITQKLVSDTWGLAPYDKLLGFLQEIAGKRTDEVIAGVREHIDAGNDMMALIGDLAEMMRNCLLIKKQPDSDYITDSLPEHLIPSLKQAAEQFTETELIWMFKEMLDLHRQLQIHSRFRLQLVEVNLIRIIQGRPRYNIAEIIERLEKLESSAAPVQEPSKKPQVSSEKVSEKKAKPKKQASKVSETKTKPEPKPAPKKTTEPASKSEEKKQKPAEKPQKTTWKDIVEAVPIQTRAYLHNHSRISKKDGMVQIWFDPRWKKHVEQLRNKQHTDAIIEAIEEKTGQKKEIEILLDTDNDSENSEDTEKGTEQNNRLLEQTIDLFKVDSVKKIKKK